MVESSLQKRIDEIQWYHEFDFGGGLKAQSFTPFTVCTPFEGVNAIHTYEPPFKLGDYDDRFRTSASL
jgi:hypothetical protein